MRAHTTIVRVRYAETDQMGVVYHANYLVWMEVGRVECCREAGVRYRDLEAEGVRLAVVEVRCRYLAPAHYDEEVAVRTWIAEASTRMVRFGYEMRHAGNGLLLATAETRHVFLGADMKPRKLPERNRGLFGLSTASEG
ncbi:MAG: acyl-CoA thioesterase [Bryobacteraceae bacterium]